MNQQSADVLLYPRLIRRVRAFLIDSMLLVMLIYLWMFSVPAFGDISFSIKILLLLVPLVVIEPGLVAFTGGSPGHHIMGLRVRDASADRNIGILLATARAFIRAFFGWVSFIFVLVTQKHQALHDYFTSTIVVLRRPDMLPAYEKQLPRTENHVQYVYPSKARRIVFILLYVTLTLIGYSFLLAILVSEDCVIENRCNAPERFAVTALGVIWLLCLGAAIVMGWKGLLYGARRAPLTKEVHPGA